MVDGEKYQAVLLTLSLKFELEDCGRDIATIQRAISRKTTRGMHGKRMVTLIIVTDELVQAIGSRLRPIIDGANSVENFWIMLAPKPNDVFGQWGSFDPAVNRIREAWVDAWNRNKPQDMREAQRRNARFKDR